MSTWLNIVENFSQTKFFFLFEKLFFFLLTIQLNIETPFHPVNENENAENL